jgi:hypothetical protein
MSYSEYWAAGGHAGQPAYNQFYVNCYVGCGPVAWAMLFGWVDRQAAAGNPRWTPYWGIYRSGGGYGADAVAPIYQDTGVNNMIRELAGHVGTFCMFDSGATYPWTMWQATRYVSGRSHLGLETPGTASVSPREA